MLEQKNMEELIWHADIMLWAVAGTFCDPDTGGNLNKRKLKKKEKANSKTLPLFEKLICGEDTQNGTKPPCFTAAYSGILY